MKLIYLATFLTLLSCVPGQESAVEVAGQASIVNQVKVSSSIEKEIGEWSLETEPMTFTITIENNSSRPITKLAVELKKMAKVDGLDYATTKSLAEYPGEGGTCGSVVSSGASCTINLTFAPKQSGNFHYQVIFNYRNLIGAESQQLEYFALAGIPASLVYTNEESQYDLGIVEQVDDGGRFPLMTQLEIENRGELSATNINFVMASTGVEPNAFTVSSHTCPEKLAQFQKCTIDVAYVPLNQDINDPEAKYSSSIAITYGSDQDDKPATLTGNFKALSTKIVGRFERSGLENICFRPDEETPCGPTTVGNTINSSFKIINKGFQSAIVKVVTVGFNDMLVHCEVGAGENLLCYRAGYFLRYNAEADPGYWYLNGGDKLTEFIEPAGHTCKTIEEDVNRICLMDNPPKTQLTLYEFPFLIQDTDECMTNETRVSGKDILNQGSERCEIGVKFHPPEQYNRDGFVASGVEFDELPIEGPEGPTPIEMGVIYDSLWKDIEGAYIETTPMLFKSNPKSHSQARLRVTRFSFGSINTNYRTPDEDLDPGDVAVGYDEDEFYYDIGRFPMVLDNTIKTDGRIKIKNFGYTRAYLTGVHVLHGGLSIDIPSVNADGPTSTSVVCAPSGEPFFRKVRHFCTHNEYTGESWIDPGESCDIRFAFTPVSETNKIYQNYCMFGIPIDDSRYDQACLDSPSSCNALTPTDFRTFSISYTDGVSLDDTLNPINSEKNIQFKIDASLAASGKLELGTLPSPGNPNYFAKSLEIDTAPTESYRYAFMALRNVGSNSIPYIYLQNNHHLDTLDYGPRVHGMSFVQANLHPSVIDGSYKDCYYLIQNKPQDQLFAGFSQLYPNVLPHQPGTTFNNSSFVTALSNYQGNPAEPVTSLDKGESCVLAIRYKRPYGRREHEIQVGGSMRPIETQVSADNTLMPGNGSGRNFLKHFIFNHEQCDGTLEGLPPDVIDGRERSDDLRFYYFDNDTDTTGGLVPDNPELGNRNYVYQDDEEEFQVNASEFVPSSIYAEIERTSLVSFIRHPAKTFPGIDMSPVFNVPAQNIPEAFYIRQSGSHGGTLGSFSGRDGAIQAFKDLMPAVETLSGENMDDYDYAVNLGIFPNVDSADYTVRLRLQKQNLRNEGNLTNITYTPLYSGSGGEGHKILPTLSTDNNHMTFRVNSSDTTTGMHIGIVEFSYLTNIKIETSRLGNPCNNYLGDVSKNGDSDTNFVMLDVDDPAKFDYVEATKKMLVFTKIYEPNLSPQFKVYGQHFNVCQDPATKEIFENDPYDNTDDHQCPDAPPIAAEMDFGETYKVNQADDNGPEREHLLIEDIYGEELYAKARIRIENTGTLPMENMRLDIVKNKGAVTVQAGEVVLDDGIEVFNSFDYLAMNTGAPNHPAGALAACGGTLAVGESCAFYIKFHSINRPVSFSRWFNVTYTFGDEGVPMAEQFRVHFGVLEPATFVVEGYGTPLATLNDLTDDLVIDETNTSQFIDEDYGLLWEQGSAASAIRLPMDQIALADAPTIFQFHLKFRAVSGDLKAFVRQDFFNVDHEDAGGPLGWTASDINKQSNVDNKSRITIDYDFDGSPIYPGIPTCGDLQAGDTGLDHGDECTVVVNYRIDETFVNANSVGNSNGHEGFYMRYCNNYPGINPLGCSTGTLYFVVTGDIVFPNASTVDSNLIFSNIQATDEGTASFAWSDVSYNTNWSDGVVDYRIDYGSSEKTLSTLEAQSNGSIVDREATLTGLIRGSYYNFEIKPVLRSKYTGNLHNVQFEQGQQTVRILVPDDGLTYFHDQELLIKPVSIGSDYYSVESVCQDPVSIGGINQPMRVFNQTHYDFLNGIAHPSINPFSIYWTQDTDFVDEVLLEEVECVFPAPSLATSEDFSESVIYKMIGDTEGSGYKNESHNNCYKNYLWVPVDFIGSGLEAKTICIYDDLDL